MSRFSYWNNKYTNFFLHFRNWSQSARSAWEPVSWTVTIVGLLGPSGGRSDTGDPCLAGTMALLTTHCVEWLHGWSGVFDEKTLSVLPVSFSSLCCQRTWIGTWSFLVGEWLFLHCESRLKNIVARLTFTAITSISSCLCWHQSWKTQ